MFLMRCQDNSVDRNLWNGYHKEKEEKEKFMFQKGMKAAIVACSNGLARESKKTVIKLEKILKSMGIELEFSPYLYKQDTVFSGSGKQRAEILMDYFMDDNIQVIFDISGGDLANEILSYVDFGIIEKYPKPFFGYSDLTTIINAIYSQTGNSAYLYQVRNLVSEHGKKQKQEFFHTFFEDGRELYDISYQWLQGEAMEGIVVGGNIRCLLKLAGTKYWPDMKGKILFLESRSGGADRMTACLSQLKQMGVFEQISGILLGTFTEMEMKQCQPGMEILVKEMIGNKIPIAKTQEIGHGTDSKCLIIGEYAKFNFCNISGKI